MKNNPQTPSVDNVDGRAVTASFSCSNPELLRAAHERARAKLQSFSAYVVSCIQADLGQTDAAIASQVRSEVAEIFKDPTTLRTLIGSALLNAPATSNH